MAIVQSRHGARKGNPTSISSKPKDIHEGAGVYIYTRVSLVMQVDGYSLEAQEDEIKRYTDRYNMHIAGSYSDKGFSGKNIAGRQGFQAMLADIDAKKDDIRFVIVFKLSRFGRNAADILTTIKHLKRRGIDLICVKDGLDSSTEQSKLFIAIMAAMAEIERENIHTQTMAGRYEKARKGGWNGGFAPYGYSLDNGLLVINEEEAKIIRLIFNKYVNTTMGMGGVAKWLNENGYRKIMRNNIRFSTFSTSFVRGVLDNPVYAGKMPYGRRHTVPKDDNPDEYHVVVADQYHLYEGQQDAIIPEEIWQKATKKRTATSLTKEKLEKEHNYILSGLLRCPGCGAPLYGIASKKHRKDGTAYPVSYAYKCRNNTQVTGHTCSWHRQVACNRIDNGVASIIKALTTDPHFIEIIQGLIDEKIDHSELEQAVTAAQRNYNQVLARQHSLEMQIDALDPEDAQYDKMFESLQRRLYNTFDEIDAADALVQDTKAKLDNVEKEQLTRDSIYNYLLLFGEVYDKMSDYEKQTLMRSMIDSIEIYPEKQENGQQIKAIHFKFPVSYHGELTRDIFPPKESCVETVVLLSNVKQ